MTEAADEFDGPDLEKLRKAAALMSIKERLEKYRKIDRIVLHPKQREFINLGCSVSERALFAGSQQGKSTVGAYELVYHLTGDYPPDWQGRRFNRVINAWAIGPSAQHVRDVMQAKLCGNIDALDGLIPLEAYDPGHRPSRSHALGDMFDQVRVKHKSRGVSLLTFKSFEQGREKLQGAGIDVIWTDEDCPVEIWTELVARTIATAGIVFATFTPIKGCLPVAQRFLQEQSPSRGHVIMQLTDALHIPVERHAEIIAQIPEHERDARVYGIPSAGEGKVFQVSEDMIKEALNPANVPDYWPLAWAIDFGHTKNHPFAAVLGAWDRSNDIIHVIHALRVHGGLPINHASAMRSALNGLAADVVVIWPHDGHAPSRESNRPTMQLYKVEGLRMLPDHATFEKGGFDFEAGLSLMHGRLASSKLRVAAHLTEWFQEYRMYHRVGGLVNKINDDLMSATRILCMSIRKAKEMDNHRPWFQPGEPYRKPGSGRNGPPPPAPDEINPWTGQ
jgi:phage terminase large subunit-like protein